MSRHTEALLGDLHPRASASASTWFYAVLLILALGGAERVYRQISKANQKRAWELDQRRRHGIPDDDKRPFKIAHRDAAVRARRQAESAEAQTRALREQEMAKKKNERKAAVEKEWEQVNSGQELQGRGPRRRRQPQAAAGRELPQDVARFSSPDASMASPSFPGAMPGTTEPVEQPASQPEMSHVSNPAQASRKRTHPGDTEDPEEDAHASLSAGRGAQRRRTDVPRGTKRTANSEEADEEVDDRTVAHRAKIRAGKRRQIGPASDAEGDDQDQDDDDESYQPSQGDKSEEDETMQSNGGSDAEPMDQDAAEHSQTPRKAAPQDKGKKRLLDDVDADSVVSRSGGRTRADRKRRKNKDERLPVDGARFQESSEEETVQRKPSRRQGRATARPARRAPPAQPAPLQRRESQIVRRPGDEWTDKAGLKWRWGEDGHKRRSVAVKETRKRYDMPKDSKHPDANVTMQVLVEKWLTEAEYEQARSDRKLAWQSDEEVEKPAAPATGASSRGKSLYHLTGSIHPLRASTSMASLAGRVARNVTPLRRSYMTSGSLAGLGDSGSSAPNSPADKSFGLSHSRARLVSTPLRGGLGSSAHKKPLTDEERKQREADLVRKLTQADKPATPAPAPAPLPSTTVPAASTPAPAASTFSFGASPAPAAAASATPETKPAAEATKPPTFSFGATPAKTETAASSGPAAATFSFGAGKIQTPADTEPAASTSFGATPAANPAPATATPSSSSAPTFSFGASSAKPATPAAPTPAATAAPPSFSFGAAPAAGAIPAAPSAPTFSFGAAPSAVTAAAPAATSTPSFSFGASTSAAPKSASSAPSFSFGAAPSEPAASSPASFSFGAAPSAPTTGSAPAPAAAAPSFSFGAAPSATPSAPSFSFGAAPSAPASGGFSFGSGGSTGSTFSFGKK